MSDSLNAFLEKDTEGRRLLDEICNNLDPKEEAFDEHVKPDNHDAHRLAAELSALSGCPVEAVWPAVWRRMPEVAAENVADHEALTGHIGQDG